MKLFCTVLGMSLIIVGCSHPIEITGQGDVLSATGNRDCLLEDFHDGLEQCVDNVVMGEYKETYTAVARPGWQFEGWGNYCLDVDSDECKFAVSQKAVRDFWGVVVPPLKARFTRTGCTPATSSDIYSPTSYDSCYASENDLTGVWMIVSDYSLISGSRTRREWIQKQRSIMTITDNENGTLNVQLCNNPFDGPFQNHTFDARASTLVIRDARVQADIHLRVTDSVSMVGEHASSADVSVQRSVVNAIKILDIRPVSIGTLDLDYNLNGNSYSEKAADVSCFSQAAGSINNLDFEIYSETESIRFVTEVEYQGVPVDLKAEIALRNDGDKDPSVWLEFFLANYTEIEGGDRGNVKVVYEANSSRSVALKATVKDDVVPTNSAKIGLKIELQ